MAAGATADLQTAAYETLRFIELVRRDWHVELTTHHDAWRLVITKRVGGYGAHMYFGELGDVFARALAGATPDAISR